MAGTIDKMHQLHDALLKVYLARQAKIRDTGLDFTFVVKKNNNPNFKKGYWFHTGKSYIATSPYNLFYPEKEEGNKGRNRVPALSFGVRNLQNGEGQVYLGLVPWKERESFFRGVFNYFKDNQRFILEGDEEHVFKLDDEAEYPLSPKGMDADQIKEVLRNFLEADVRAITGIAKENGMADEDLFVKADDLQGRLDEIARIRKTLASQSSSQVRSEPVTGGDSAQNRKEPLNVIFYGPPGTGKTFHTVSRALKIVNGSVPFEREEQLMLFNELRGKGQIEMITFHQNFAYEDFIEGIKPNLDDNAGDGLAYELKDGIFKEIANRANENREYGLAESDEKLDTKNLTEDYASFIEESVENQEKVYLYDDKRETSKVFLGVKRDRNGKFQSFVLNSAGTVGKSYLRYPYIERYYAKFEKGQIKSSSDIRQVSNQEKRMFKAAEYFALFQHMKKHGEKHGKTPVQTMDERKNYVLIIDEINRGNIAKIFGELITLIEESKRLGRKEALRVKLPYSHDPEDPQDGFGVPDNLYIIGTMNTADRSLTLLDTALRRRFDFEEMMPNPSLLRDKKPAGIDCEALLHAINARIKKEHEYGREHQIGHSYFMGKMEEVEDVKRTFQRNILPLLQEYFFDGWEKIAAVLGGNGFVQKDGETWELLPYGDSAWDNAAKYTAIYKEAGNSTQSEGDGDADDDEGDADDS